jgi:hypothetical protein
MHIGVISNPDPDRQIKRATLLKLTVRIRMAAGWIVKFYIAIEFSGVSHELEINKIHGRALTRAFSCTIKKSENTEGRTPGSNGTWQYGNIFTFCAPNL